MPISGVTPRPGAREIIALSLGIATASLLPGARPRGFYLRFFNEIRVACYRSNVRDS